MYLRNVLKGNKLSTFSRFSNKKFSILDVLNRDTISYRMSKYDPTKELEVNLFKFRLTNQMFSPNHQRIRNTRLPDWITVSQFSQRNLNTQVTYTLEF